MNSYFLKSLRLFFSVLLIIFYIPNLTLSQSFENLLIRQGEDSLIIDYDIYGGREYDLYKIDLSLSSDGGKTFAILPNTATGDVGYGVSRGRNKRIFWEPLKESKELIGENFIVKLNGTLLGTSNEVEMVEVKGGTFEMGDSFGEGYTDETYLHTVSIDDFQISKYEVTNHQYAVFLKKYQSDKVKSGEFQGEVMIYENEKGLKYVQNEWQPVAGYEYHPVVGVTWYGANEFCQYYEMRLPTEAEWEYAAREMGKIIRFGNGENVADPKKINFNGNLLADTSYSYSGENRSSTISVGGMSPNNLGLFQMSGNVWEWCQDWYASNYYHKSKEHNPTGPWMGKYKSIRGGSWFNSAKGVRIYERSFLSPHRYASDLGFRTTKSISEFE